MSRKEKLKTVLEKYSLGRSPIYVSLHDVTRLLHIQIKDFDNKISNIPKVLRLIKNHYPDYKYIQEVKASSRFFKIILKTKYEK